MLKTIISFNLFEDFCNNQPAQVPLGSKEDNRLWLSFWDFLKSKSDVTITDYNNQENIFLTGLTTGRKGSKVYLKEQFKTPYKYKFPDKQHFGSIFFMDEPENIQQKYKRNNNFIFGFRNDYFKKWKELSFISKHKTLHIRKIASSETQFSWLKFQQQLLPFTDTIIVDPYIFKDKSIIKENLGKLVDTFYKVNSAKVNLLIISNIRNVDTDFTIRSDSIKHSLRLIKDYLFEKNVIDSNKVNLSIVHTFREHDRYMFFNYFYCEFGTSLQFSDSKSFYGFTGKSSSIRFFPYTDSQNYKDAALIITDIKTLIESCFKNDNYIGNLKNKLLNFS